MRSEPTTSTCHVYALTQLAVQQRRASGTKTNHRIKLPWCFKVMARWIVASHPELHLQPFSKSSIFTFAQILFNVTVGRLCWSISRLADS